MAKPNRTCFGRGMCLHIGLCCDFWADDGLCVCDPVDAAEYPHAQRLYIAGNISGFSSPNIRTILPDGSDKVHTFDRGDYCWVSWDWGANFGTAKFELRDGTSVKATRSTEIVSIVNTGDLTLVGYRFPPSWGTPPAKIIVGTSQYISAKWTNNTANPLYSPYPMKLHIGDHIIDPIEGYDKPGYWIQSGLTEGVTFHHVFDTVGHFAIKGSDNPNNLTHYIEVIPEPDPCAGVICENVCIGADLYSQKCVNGVCVTDALITANCPDCPGYVPPLVCTEGEKRTPKTCWDGSKIHEQLCMGNKWIPSGETCPPMPAHGEKRSPTTCWDDSVIHAEMFDATLKQWVPTGETPPPKPECTEGDKKAGYVCVAGKWQPTPAVPEPVVPPVEPPVTPPAALPKYLTPAEADELVREGLPCYIKCTLPLLDMLPGIPYTPGMWAPPFCEITAEP